MELLTPNQVAEMLGVSIQTIHKLCRQRKLEFIQIDSKNRRFKPEMIERFIEAKTCPASYSPTGGGPGHKGADRVIRPRRISAEKSIEALRKEMEAW